MLSIGLTVDTFYETITVNQIRTPMKEVLLKFSENLFIFLHRLTFCASFFIFIFVSKAFRHELKRMIYNIFGKHLMVIREEENRQENIE
jgi:hypothetical protein